MTTKILCVSDGGVTTEMMEGFKELEHYGAKVTIVEDADMKSMAEITDRMGKLEKGGVDSVPSCQALLDNCADADILVVHVASINKEVLDAAPILKLAVVLRGGYENADTEALAERGITMVNAPWRSANAVADFTVGMMIAENKNIARSHKLLHDGVWCKKYSNQSHIRDMRKCTVGVVGFGYIGSRVVKRLQGFESKVIVFDPWTSKEEIEAAGATPVNSFEELLKESDFVTLHMRISDQTHHMINDETLALMKPTAYFVNTARADLVDEDALIRALQAHQIGGAAIDVYSDEPLSSDSPYLQLDNVTLTSHLAGTSSDTMQTSAEIGIEEVERFLQGKPLLNVRV